MASPPAPLAATLFDSAVERATVEMVYEFQEMGLAVVDMTCERCFANFLHLMRPFARVEQSDLCFLSQVPEDLACRLPMRAPEADVEF